MYGGHYQILADAINLRCIDMWSANIKYRREREQGFDLGDRQLSPEDTLAIADAFLDADNSFRKVRDLCVWEKPADVIVVAVKAAFKKLDAAKALEARLISQAGK